MGELVKYINEGTIRQTDNRTDSGGWCSGGTERIQGGHTQDAVRFQHASCAGATARKAQLH